MPLSEFTPLQFAVGAFCALLIGFAKTGVPGSGILVVPLMAGVFGGRLSVGATLPLLIFADCFAVAFYRAHAQWDHLRRLFPYVVVGLGLGTWFLDDLAQHPRPKDPLNPLIGSIVLAMLALSLARGKWGERLAPQSAVGTRAVGVLGGFTTMVSNAAGPIMQIYLVGTKMSKEHLMGTAAIYFFIINTSKLPLLYWLTVRTPTKPLITVSSLWFDLALAPLILAGALIGRHLLGRIPQEAFNGTILVLSTIAAIILILT